MEFHKEKVSIIIATYNRAYCIDNAIKSISNQTYKNWELIIVDDCSTDNTTEIAHDFQKKDNRINFFKLDKNSGACAARNFGIKKAVGEYITFLDSDDEYLPEKIEKQVEYFKNTVDKDLAVVSCGALDFRDNKEYNRRMPQARENVYLALLGKGKRIGAGTPFLMVKSDIIKKENILFDPQMPAMQDWDFLIRICKKYNFNFVRDYLVRVNHHSNDRVYNSKNAIVALKLQYDKYLEWLLEKPEEHLGFVKNAASIIAVRESISKGKKFVDKSLPNFHEVSKKRKLEIFKFVLSSFRFKYFKLFYLKYLK